MFLYRRWYHNDVFCFSTRFIPLLDSAEEKCLCVVVGTKSDLLTEADTSLSSSSSSTLSSTPSAPVPAQHGIQLAREMNQDRHFETQTPYFETSSLLNKNVIDVFEYIFQTLLPLDSTKIDEIRSKRSASLVDLNMSKTDKKTEASAQKGCC